MRTYLKPIIMIAILLGVGITAYTFLNPYLTADAFPRMREILSGYVSAYPILAPVAFGIAYAVSTALSLPFGSFLTLMAGFLFGLIGGTIVVVLGATIGATGIFLIAKTALGATLRQRAGPFYQKMEAGMKENAVSYLLFLRLVPAFPFWLVNIVPALFNVPLTTYVWTTMLGILPGTAIFVNLGRSLSNIDQVGDLIGPDILISLTLLGLISLMPMIVKKIKARKNV